MRLLHHLQKNKLLRSSQLKLQITIRQISQDCVMKEVVDDLIATNINFKYV